MTASDSPTNLAWLINQSSPSARVEAMPTADAKAASRRSDSDFGGMQIEPEMLDRAH